MPICDTLLRNVRVIDGSGSEAFPADVALDAGRISAIGQLADYSAGQTIEGDGRVLSPGFIDVHTHDDTSVIRPPPPLDPSCRLAFFSAMARTPKRKSG